MKNTFRFCLSVLLIAVLAVLLVGAALRGARSRKLFSPAEAASEPVAAPAPQESAPGQPEGAGGASLAAAQARPVLKKVLLADIPASVFKTELLALEPLALKRALATLSEVQFVPSDVESLRAAPNGGVCFVCSFGTEKLEAEACIQETPGDAEAGAALEAAGASAPVSSPPLRHSRPGANKVLFLDFNGHVISGTMWNSWLGTESWDCRPFDRDGDETTFSASEQADIIQIWERVAEDYAPFDVDVTTEQPAAWGPTTGHALITPPTDKNGVHCPHYGYGGVAAMNAFGTPGYSYDSPDAASPVWVKDMSLANLAEAVTHELGHNMGLAHHGSSAGAYYYGHENGGIGWGCIMGVSYGRNVSQWTQGEYHDSNNPQDDLAVVAGKLGYRPDDYGDSNATAFALAADPSGNISRDGVVETSGNPDVFSFSTLAGTVNLSATPYRAASSTWGGNLDVLLELYDGSGVLVATNNPAFQTTAAITETLTAGTYYLHVKPVGAGAPLANPPTGYAVYGSLGQYWISGVVSADADDDGIPNEWEIQYFGGFTNAVAATDTDGDGLDNLTEYVSGYDPTNSSSVFQFVESSAPPFVLIWNPVAGRVYNVLWSDDMACSPFTLVGTNIPWTQNGFTDTVERAGPKNFYRVEVRLDQ